MLYLSLVILAILVCLAIFGLGRLSAYSPKLGRVLFVALVATLVATLVVGLYWDRITLIAGE